jgi:hypothetical protein
VGVIHENEITHDFRRSVRLADANTPGRVGESDDERLGRGVKLGRGSPVAQDNRIDLRDLTLCMPSGLQLPRQGEQVLAG